MTRESIGRVVLIALVVAAGVKGTTQTQGRSLPTFEVDRAWPKVPPQMEARRSLQHRDRCAGQRLGPPSSADARQAGGRGEGRAAGDRVRHGGQFHQGLGRRRQRLRVARTRARHPHRLQGLRLARRQQLSDQRPARAQAGCRRSAPEVHAGRQVRHADRPQQPEQGQQPTRGTCTGPRTCGCYPQTNELFVADGYGNHRVAVFDADTGAFKRMWGAFGNKPMDDDHCEVVTPTTFSDPGPQQFSIVHAIRVAKDGMVYVADRENRRVQMFTNDGKFVKQLVRNSAPFARDLALSPDAATAVPLCRRRQWRLHRRSQDARDRGQHPAAGHDWRRPPDRHRFEGQSSTSRRPRPACRS